jgi:branched-chain amino acid transport system ATP-binding protein
MIMLLNLKDIMIHYGGVEAVRGLSLHLEKGEIITIIGSNGAGKTSTLKTISGIKRITSGEIWFDDARIDGYPPHKIVARGISHVPEGRGVFSNMSVFENLRMGAFLKSTDEFKKALSEVYRIFPILRDRTNQCAGSLSGGEQQMLAMGRALVAKPKIILLDEPTLGLSPLLVVETARVIHEMCKGGGISAILVEQNAEIALRIAHRGYVLEGGRLVIEGLCNELRDSENVKKAYLGG